MRISRLILQHLIQSKKVTLQGIGTFYLQTDISGFGDMEKEIQIPEGAVTFNHDPKAKEDEALISFIISQTHKVRSLATSDLESYVGLGSQFINIGKPFIINGLGLIQKNPSGQIEFIASREPQKFTEPIDTELRERTTGDVSFASPARSRKYNKTMIAVVATFLLLLALVVFYFSTGGGEKEIPVAISNDSAKVQQIIPADTTPTVAPVIKDSLSSIADTLNVSNATVETATPFRIVLKQYPSAARAQRFMDMVRNSYPTITTYTADSVNFKVAVVITAPLSDTARARDSIARIIGLPVFVETGN